MTSNERRNFLKQLAAGGLLLGVGARAGAVERQGSGTVGAAAVNGWVRITPSNEVTLLTMITGEQKFAQTYVLSRKVLVDSTITRVSDVEDPSSSHEPVKITITVARNAPGDEKSPRGTVTLMLDGREYGKPQSIDESGRAVHTIPHLKAGKHVIVAHVKPNRDSHALPSSSAEFTQLVRAARD